MSDNEMVIYLGDREIVVCDSDLEDLKVQIFDNLVNRAIEDMQKLAIRLSGLAETGRKWQVNIDALQEAQVGLELLREDLRSAL